MLDWKPPVGVNMSMKYWLMCQRLVQGVPRLLPNVCWDRLQPLTDLIRTSCYRRYMDGLNALETIRTLLYYFFKCEDLLLLSASFIELNTF